MGVSVGGVYYSWASLYYFRGKGFYLTTPIQFRLAIRVRGVKKETNEFVQHIKRLDEEADSGAKPTDNKIILLLEQIEENTSATHLWTRVIGIPVFIGLILAVLNMVW